MLEGGWQHVEDCKCLDASLIGGPVTTDPRCAALPGGPRVASRPAPASAMDDLIAFLRARLNEDERKAVGATAGPWRHNPDKHWRGPGTAQFEEAVFAGPPGADAACIAGTGETGDPQSMLDAEHIARWDPARVLAEVEAKRRMLDECSHELSRSAPRSNLNDFACTILRNLGASHADHPEYRKEWRP